TPINRFTCFSLTNPNFIPKSAAIIPLFASQ
ncbi:MAG: hypothetical protein ACI9DK_002664, partial [Vicingaceae bacterium]